MTAIITQKFRVANAAQFKKSFETDNYYMFIGNVNVWPTYSESSSSIYDTATTPTDTQESEYNHWYTMLSARKIDPNNAVHITRRINWKSGQVFDEYDDVDENIFDNKNYYVLTDEFNVYKCISNNYGAASTKKPIGNGTGLVSHDPDISDGYIWKYLFTVPEIMAEKFLSKDWIPIPYLDVSAGSDDTCGDNRDNLQRLVQEAAVPGAINNIIVTAGGSSYDTAPTVTITGNGTGATAVAVADNDVSSSSSNNGSILRIVVTNPGEGYTRASIVITATGDGSGATARAVMSPVGGHGSDPIYELGGKYVMCRVKLRFDDEDSFTGNNYRKIGILMNPIEAEQVSNEDVFASAITYSQMTNIIIAANGITGSNSQFEIDEIVEQADTSASGRVVEQSIDDATGIITLKLTEVLGTFTTTADISSESGAIAQSSPNIIEIVEPELRIGTGHVIYVDQRTAISRELLSSEEIRVIVVF